MDGRVYVSSGRPNRDEKKMIEELTNAVNKLKEKNPVEYMNFRPATNKFELREWYKKYCIEDAERLKVLMKLQVTRTLKRI